MEEETIEAGTIGSRTVEDVGGVEARVGAEARVGKETTVVGKETGAGEGASTGSITGSITVMTGSETGSETESETESETGTPAKEVALLQVLQTPLRDTALIPRDHIMTATDLFNLQDFLSIHTIQACTVLFSATIGKGQLEGGVVVGSDRQTDRQRERESVVAIVLAHS